MKNIVKLLALGYVFIILTACSSSNNEIKSISKVLGIDCFGGTISQSIDSHGGFHGDGTFYLELKYDDEKGKAVVHAIEETTDWEKLPLTDNLRTALYGKKSETESAGPYITNDNGEALFPSVSNGYYFFYDRLNKSKEDTRLFKRFSFNFTIALYDMDTQTLYYCEYDT